MIREGLLIKRALGCTGDSVLKYSLFSLLTKRQDNSLPAQAGLAKRKKLTEVRNKK
jgi:hypothetical protein